MTTNYQTRNTLLSVNFTMKSRLSADLRGVSPVIGVILMVAVTVILAATVGNFVLTVTDDQTDNSPLAGFAFSIPNEDTVEVTHDGGDKIPADELVIVVNGVSDDPLADSGGDVNLVEDAPAEISPGSRFTVDDSLNGNDNFGSGDTVRIVWVSPDTSQTKVLGEVTV